MLVLFFLFPQYPFVATVKIQILGLGTFDLTQYRCSCETGTSVKCPAGKVCSSPSELPSSRSLWQGCGYLQHHYLACSTPCPPLPCLCSLRFLPNVCINYLLNYRSIFFSCNKKLVIGMVFENEQRYIDPLDLVVMEKEGGCFVCFFFSFLKALGAICWVQ